MSQITVATINLNNSDNQWLKRRHLLVAQLMDASPDLISLQEISLPARQGHWLRNQINVRLTGSVQRPYRLVQKRKRHLIYGYFEGVGVLSKLPVEYHDSVSLGYGGRLALRVNVVLASHQTLDFVAVHLHNISHDHEARLEQVMRLNSWLNGRRRVPYQIIAGDFNEIPTGLAIEYIKQSYHSAYEYVHGHEPLATFPTALIDRLDGWAGCLDYIFISKSLKKIPAISLFCDKPDDEDDTLYPSDHVGLISTVEI